MAPPPGTRFLEHLPQFIQEHAEPSEAESCQKPHQKTFSQVESEPYRHVARLRLL